MTARISNHPEQNVTANAHGVQSSNPSDAKIKKLVKAGALFSAASTAAIGVNLSFAAVASAPLLPVSIVLGIAALICFFIAWLSAKNNADPLKVGLDQTIARMKELGFSDKMIERAQNISSKTLEEKGIEGVVPKKIFQRKNFNTDQIASSKAHAKMQTPVDAERLRSMVNELKTAGYAAERLPVVEGVELGPKEKAFVLMQYTTFQTAQLISPKNGVPQTQEQLIALATTATNLFNLVWENPIFPSNVQEAAIHLMMDACTAAHDFDLGYLMPVVQDLQAFSSFAGTPLIVPPVSQNIVPGWGYAQTSAALNELRKILNQMLFECPYSKNFNTLMPQFNQWILNFGWQLSENPYQLPQILLDQLNAVDGCLFENFSMDVYRQWQSGMTITPEVFIIIFSYPTQGLNALNNPPAPPQEDARG